MVLWQIKQKWERLIQNVKRKIVGLVPRTRIIGPRKKLIPAKNRMLNRPLNLRPQNKFSLLIILTFFWHLSNIFVYVYLKHKHKHTNGLQYFGGKIKRSLVKFVGLEKTVTKNGDRLSKSDEKFSYLIKYLKAGF